VIAVLCMVVMLSVLLLIFNEESRANLSEVEDFRKSAQALNCARAGLNIAVAAARNLPGTDSNRSLQSLFSSEKPIKLDQGECLISVSEESGKLNVNLLKEENGGLNRTRTEQLLKLIDTLNQERSDDTQIEYDVVPGIIDWIDSDDEVTSLPFIKRKNQGVESDYYSRLDPPYRCRNASLETIDELLLVKGFSPEVFGRLRGYLTVYGADKVNVNSAPKQVLASLSEQMDATLAQVIVERRNQKPFESVSELRELPGVTDSLYTEISRMLTVDPADRYYNVSSRGEVDGLDRTASAIIRMNERTRRVEVVLYREPKS